MPVVVGAHHPRLLMGGEVVDVGVRERYLPAVDFDHARLPHVEEPAALVLEFAVEFRHLFAELDRFTDDVVHQEFALIVHHLGCDVEGGDHIVLRGGGAVHHVGFVEFVRIDFHGAAVLDMQH